MRTFIAIELSKETKDWIAHLQGQLKNSGADVKWVEPENIHLTLKFLGEIDNKQLSNIIKVLQDSNQNRNSFYIRLSSLGAFPKINFPRVIWIGIDKGEAESKQIATDLEEELAKIGIPKEEKRPFSCHITLGRLRSVLNRDRLIKDLDNLANNFTPPAPGTEFLVTKITLFKSTLTPRGPIYEILKEIPLKTS